MTPATWSAGLGSGGVSTWSATWWAVSARRSWRGYGLVCINRVDLMTLPALQLDPGPIARLEHVKKQADTAALVFHRLCEGETLREIARAWEVPVGPFTEWYMQAHGALFDAAKRVRADELAHEALATADAATPENVAPAKLQVETRLKLAGHWDRAGYGAGKDAQSGGGVQVIVDRSCGGTVSVRSGNSEVVVTGGGVSPERVIGSAEALPAHSTEEPPI